MVPGFKKPTFEAKNAKLWCKIWCFPSVWLHHYSRATTVTLLVCSFIYIHTHSYGQFRFSSYHNPTNRMSLDCGRNPAENPRRHEERSWPDGGVEPSCEANHHATMLPILLYTFNNTFNNILHLAPHLCICNGVFPPEVHHLISHLATHQYLIFHLPLKIPIPVATSHLLPKGLILFVLCASKWPFGHSRSLCSSGFPPLAWLPSYRWKTLFLSYDQMNTASCSDRQRPIYIIYICIYIKRNSMDFMCCCTCLEHGSGCDLHPTAYTSISIVIAHLRLKTFWIRIIILVNPFEIPSFLSVEVPVPCISSCTFVLFKTHSLM